MSIYGSFYGDMDPNGASRQGIPKQAADIARWCSDELGHLSPWE